MGISIILPTRGRYGPLERSLTSLYETAADQTSIEVLLALDDDDSETIRRIKEDGLCFAGEQLKTFVGPRLGYINLHVYVNHICARASGEWLFLWNDDTLMQTQRWDDVVRSYSGQFLLLNPDLNHGNQALGDCPFPIIPRRWFEILGHVAQNNHYDTWVQLVSKALGIRQDIPVMLLHDRLDLTGANDDATSRERVFTTAQFFSTEVQRLVRADFDALRTILTNRKS